MVTVYDQHGFEYDVIQKEQERRKHEGFCVENVDWMIKNIFKSNGGEIYCLAMIW